MTVIARPLARLACLLLLGGCQALPAAMDPDVAAIEDAVGGRIGAYAYIVGESTPLIAHRADERFALASTFKALLVAAVLERVERGELALSDTRSLSGVEIQPHSPVTGQRGPGGRFSIAELCDAAITISDNTATNLFQAEVGGPAGVTQFLSPHGDRVTRLDRWEVELNENAPGDPRDTSTARAVAKSFEYFVLGDALSAASRERLADWLRRVAGREVVGLRGPREEVNAVEEALGAGATEVDAA